MNEEELTPLFEEMKRVLKDKIDDETLKAELTKYLNEYRVSPDAAKRGILRKYGAMDIPFAGGTIVKKIKALTGNEQNVDIVGKIMSSERKLINSRGTQKEIVSGTIGDETGNVSFTVWEPGSTEFAVGESYAFRNCYCKTWNGSVQVHVGNRGRFELAGADVEASEEPVSLPSESKKIGNLIGSEQNVDVTAKVLFAERKEVNARGEMKEIISGMIGDETGTVPLTVWSPGETDLEQGSTYKFMGCYCKTWNGTVQINVGDRGKIEPTDEAIVVAETAAPPEAPQLAPGERKKISELTGSETNADLSVKALFVERRNKPIRGEDRDIITGIIGDETGTAPFTIWEPGDLEMEKGATYVFRGCYTRVWENRVQVNIGNRGKVEPLGIQIDVPERTYDLSPPECKVKDIREGIGSITVRGMIVSAEEREIVIKGENRTVWSGILADDTGKIQYSAWKDFGLKENESVCISNAYVRSWKGIPQLNMGERSEVSRVDGDFGQIETGNSMRTVGDIMRAGGGIDLEIEGTIVDVKAGSGLIKRCPQCRRSILGGVCTMHGPVEGTSDLRIKAVIDDGTGAIGTVIGRADTEKLTGITLEEAEKMSARLGESAVAAELASKVLMRRVRAFGNVTIDDFGPNIIERSMEIVGVDVKEEARKLLKDVEANLS
ncbi:MAG: hypothetical protein IKP20_00715 [Candidatus Methanomethylophilaceae archaeon]|nr:hypothetical protein [Candidatus Methanomethylophilaceae archaeon]